MILTPLELVCIIALVILVSVTAAWLISAHHHDQLETKFHDLQNRLDRNETPDALSAWEDILNTTRKDERL